MAKEMTIERSSKDFYGRQNVTITISKEQIEIPMSILEEFVNNTEIQKSYIPIPD